jgi:hypothetical protein
LRAIEERSDEIGSEAGDRLTKLVERDKFGIDNACACFHAEVAPPPLDVEADDQGDGVGAVDVDKPSQRPPKALRGPGAGVPPCLAVRGLEPFGKIIEAASARRAFAKRRANVAYMAEYCEYPPEECRWTLGLYLNLRLWLYLSLRLH